MILVRSVLLTAAWIGALQAYNPSYDDRWNSYMKQYGKNYDDEEHDRRRATWEAAMERVNSHNEEYNNQKQNFRLAINEFSDMEDEEFFRKMTGYRRTSESSQAEIFSMSPNRLPKSVDWRYCGAVTEIKHQQQCGDCYAFSTTGALEGHIKLKTGVLVSLSEQNIVDCSENQKCEGGSIESSLLYVTQNGGIDTEADYPYENENGTCRYNRNFAAPATGRITYRRIQPGNENDLQIAVAKIGPVAVSFNAHPQTLLHYGGGIYDDPNCDGQQINHAVVAIGYGTENGMDYWLVKNQWGTSWGENGYMKLARNQGNLCGITTDSYIPLLS